MKTSKNVRELYPIYEGDDKNYRFKLGTAGKKTLIVFGLNPSTANKETSDRTISIIKKLVNRESPYNFDSFIMLNLYAQRTKDPDELHPIKDFDDYLHAKNLQHILDVVEGQTELYILAAWGGTIKIREYFIDCLHDIYKTISKRKIEWLKIGNEFTKSGKHPRHPSRISYKNSAFTNFSMIEYLKAYPSKKYEM